MWPAAAATGAGVGACAGAGAAGATLAAALQFFAASQCLLQEPFPKQAHPPNASCFDFIVVGGGTGGAALAARLAELPRARVLLLEAGGDPPHESIIPGFKDELKGSSFDWNFTTVNDHVSSQALSGGSQKQPRGKMLGGSGSLSDMIYARGFPADYDEWATIAEDDQWSWANVLDYFKKTEHLTDERIINDPEFMKLHGRGGEIEVAGLNESTPLIETFLNAFKELNFSIVRDMTSPNGIGAGRFSYTIRDGRRDSSLRGLLNKAATKPNLFVLKHTLATRILIENSTAYGVEALDSDGDLLQFYARKDVILSAGTFNTPKLLLLSGIGPKEHLETLGIEVIQDSLVGNNLHDHAMVLNYFTADNGTCFSDRPAAYMEMIRYLYDGSGSLARNDAMGAYLARNGSSTPNVPDFAFYPSCLPIHSGFYNGCTKVLGFKPSICSKLANLNKERELFTVAVVLLKPASRGSVRLSSRNPVAKPLIQSGTFSNDEDLEGYPEAIDVVRRLAETEYFKGMNASPVDFELEECRGLEGVERIKCQAKAMAMSAWHSVGTAAMGSVVDSRLRVKGIRTLRVVDASVMPKVVRGNTNSPVIMIAEKAAEYIKSDYGL